VLEGADPRFAPVTLERFEEERKPMVLPTRIRQLAVLAASVPLAAAMTTVMLAGPAAAQSAPAALVHYSSAGHNYRTVVPGLRVRKAPQTAAPVVHVLGPAGSRVTVTCFAIGGSVHGDNVWYHIVAPSAGFVAGFYLNTGRDPAAGVPRCMVLHLYRTLVTGLRVRQRPSTTAPVVHVLGAAGSPVVVNCYTTGTPVFKDNVWYHTVAPSRGFVAGVHLNTGQDPAKGVRHC
jgi:hypothetical protein